jgi:RNA polymerase sigma factor (sigma-70 family)
VLDARDGDADARKRLVEAFWPGMASIARLYRGSPAVDGSELMQEGVVGLLRALERYDTRLGTPFWAYASWWVRQAMQQAVAELTRPVVLSDRALRGLARVKDAQRELVQAHGREPSTGELAATAGLTSDQVQRLLAVDRTPRAFEEPRGADEEGGTFGELIADPVAEDEYQQVEERFETGELRSLDELGDRERGVLSAHYGLGREPETLRQIAGRLELSVERVRQIEEGALGKLREAVGLPG